VAPLGRTPPPRLVVPALLAALVAVTAVLVGTSGVLGDGGDGSAEAASPATATARKAPRRPRSVLIGWVGDTVLGSRHGVPADGGRALLAGVRPVLRRPDVMIGNLEGTIGTRGAAKCPMGTPNCFAFQAPPVAARTLRWAGFDVMNLANNHANDYGPVGLADTRRHLRDAGIAHTGTPGQITVVERRGVRVAVLGFSSYPWGADLRDVPGAARLVRRAQGQADVVVVTMHAGAEGSDQVHVPAGDEVAFGEARGPTRRFARAMVDAGAHAVLGSGPHVIRGVERRRGRPIVYSTGNFVGFHTFPNAGVLGLASAVQVRIGEDGDVQRGTWIPLRLTGPGQPSVDPAGESTALAAQLSEEDFAVPAVEPDGDLRLPRSPGR